MIYFYNPYHNGDIHYSREFVKDMMKKLDSEAYYLHGKNPLILSDIENLKYDTLESRGFNFEKPQFDSLIRKGDDIYINTWIGQKSYHFVNQYNCTLKTNYEMYKSTYDSLGIELEDISYYVPKIFFDNYDMKLNADFKKFKDDNRKKIMICNNYPYTFKVPKINLNDVTNVLSQTLNNSLFILTNDDGISKIDRENVIYVSDLVNADFDLIQSGYISCFCDIIVGKPSGPFCFTHIKENLFNREKTFLTCAEPANETFIWFIQSYSKELLAGTNQDVQEIVIKEINNE